MPYNFKKFQEKNSRLESRITITRKSYSIGFPTQYYRDNKVNEFKYVVLYYDIGNKAIGIHFTNDQSEKHKFVIHHSDQYGGSIVARSFLRSNNLDPEKYHGRYNWEKQNVEGIGEMFIIKLKSEKD